MNLFDKERNKVADAIEHHSKLARRHKHATILVAGVIIILVIILPPYPFP